MSPAAQGWVRRASVFAVIALAVLVLDRLSRIPSAIDIGGEQGGFQRAKLGQMLILSGLGTDDLMDFETAAGDGAMVMADAASIDGAAAGSTPGSAGHPAPVSWQISPGDGPPDDNKVRIHLGRVPGAAPPELSFAWADASRPELTIGVRDAPVRIEGGVEFGDQHRLPRTALSAGGVTTPALSTALIVPAGGTIRLALANFVVGGHGLRITVGRSDAMPAVPLWVREVKVVERRADLTAGNTSWSACAAADSATFLRAAWGGKPTGAACIDKALAVNSIALTGDAATGGTITTGLQGTAYTSTDMRSAWLKWLSENAVLSAIFGACVAELIGWGKRRLATPLPSAPPS